MTRHITTDDGPIHDLLARIGYQFEFERWDGNSKSEYQWKTPKGDTRRLKYQKRSGQAGPYDRYLIGIAYKRFDKIDDFVFWAENSTYLLIIPTKHLREIFVANEKTNKRIDGKWHVNTCFDIGGTQTLHPVGSRSYWVSEFAHLTEDIQ